MKLLTRILLLAALAAVVAVLSGDTFAAPSVFRPVLNRNGSLAFTDDNAQEIWLMHTDGSHREPWSADRQVPQGGATASHPRWSPDGKRIAYVFGMEMRVANADGSHVTPIGIGNDPSWTPDGALLYASGGDIFRVSLPNGTPTNLTNTLGVDEQEPVESPDGMWIAFSSNQDPAVDSAIPTPGLNYNLWIMNTTDLITSQHNIYEDVDGHYRGQPTWAPDSHRVTFIDNDDVWTTPPNGNNPTDITQSDAEVQRSPSWSPDGKLIAYSEWVSGPNALPAGSPPAQIWTIDVDTRARKNLTNDSNAHDLEPDWQPWPVQNGRVAFIGENDLSNPYPGVMTSSGEHVTTLFHLFDSFGATLTDVQYAPSGHQVALIATNNTNQTGGVAVLSDVGILDPKWFSFSSLDVGSIAWFPDGDHMVWESRPGGAVDADLYDVRPPAAPVNLTNTPGITEISPAVSLDGEHIAFLSNQQPFSDPPVAGTAIGLWTMDFDGLNRQFLTTITAPGTFNPRSGHLVSWSPNGEKIAYTSGTDLWTIGSDANNPTTPENLTDDTLFQFDVSWSPDGGLIAFDQFTLFGNGSQIWTIDPISGVRHRLSPDLPDDPSFMAPSWQPLWAPDSDRYFVWGDTRCDGKPDILDLLNTLKAMGGVHPKHIPGCPWFGDIGLNSTGGTTPWGSIACGSQLTSADIIAFFQYILDIGDYLPPPGNTQPLGGLTVTCPPLGSYTEFIPAG